MNTLTILILIILLTALVMQAVFISEANKLRKNTVEKVADLTRDINRVKRELDSKGQKAYVEENRDLIEQLLDYNHLKIKTEKRHPWSLGTTAKVSPKTKNEKQAFQLKKQIEMLEKEEDNEYNFSKRRHLPPNCSYQKS